MLSIVGVRLQWRAADADRITHRPRRLPGASLLLVTVFQVEFHIAGNTAPRTHGWNVFDGLSGRRLVNQCIRPCRRCATLSRWQLEHYRTGTVTMVGGDGSAIDLMAGDSFPVVLAGVDRYPGCPEN